MGKKFTIGETVIALTNPKDDQCQIRTRGMYYTVQDVKYTQCCGRQVISITDPLEDTESICCGQVHNFGTKRQYTCSSNFVSPKTLSEELDKALEEERYEDACLFRDLTKP